MKSWIIRKKTRILTLIVLFVANMFNVTRAGKVLNWTLWFAMLATFVAHEISERKLIRNATHQK